MANILDYINIQNQLDDIENEIQRLIEEKRKSFNTNKRCYGIS